jgi:hypothetical protein
VSNLPQVNHIAIRLGLLRKQFVFVGGSIVELLLDKTYPLEPRVTHDVDTIVEVCGYGSFSQIEKALREQGFKNDMKENVICRWHIDGITLDVMPTDPKILGFGNIWYKAAIKNATQYFLSSELDILLITAPYFLATKIEAFEGRGQQDFYGSHDLEDIITLLDGKENIIDEIEHSETDLKSYLAEKFNMFLQNTYFINALSGHLSPYQTGVNERVERLERVLSKIAKLATPAGYKIE